MATVTFVGGDGSTQVGLAWLGLAWRGVAWRGLMWLGVAFSIELGALSVEH